MEGYRPKRDGSGFEPRDGVFLGLVKEARSHPVDTYVLVIDELSRADVGRVFGEALTYLERSKRGQSFNLPSGEECSIPMNLYLIATMNHLDRGVDEVDAAFERRFAKVWMPPDPNLLEEMLDKNGLDVDLKRRLLGWFRKVNSHVKDNPYAAVGHAYFHDVVDADTLRDVWEYQLKYHIERAFKFESETAAELSNGWAAIFEVAPDDEGGGAGHPDQASANA
jgi:5-methylcytosine-specific restriction protein B